MKFTIITPNYNGEKYLEKCIKSVLDQKVNFGHM
jgi:glycosyltransferase involved in cell wall biosynthesis